MDPKRFDVMLTDVSEAGIEAIESLFQERNLRDGKFPETAFPAEGIIFGPNKRLIIDLVCQHVKHKLVPKHVFFVVDTASPVTFLSRKSIEALVEPNELFPNSLSVFVQVRI
uniref:Uncharacterized protein n=1 Tax=Ditylenchus dipsaci TaxID=166011 RepID=A0A915DUM7_9BILA